MLFVFLFKQKTAYEMRISDWSSDVCSSDLHQIILGRVIFQRAADRIIDVALYEGRVAEHAEMAQRVGKDREGKLERQLDALQIRAGAVDRRAIFEFAIGIVAPDHRIVGRQVPGQPRPRTTPRAETRTVGKGGGS